MYQQHFQLDSHQLKLTSTISIHSKKKSGLQLFCFQLHFHRKGHNWMKPIIMKIYPTVLNETDILVLIQ